MNAHSDDLSFAERLHHVSLINPPEFEAVRKAVEAVISRPVTDVTLVQGLATTSMRVHFRDGSVIAKRGNSQEELNQEAKTLRKLWSVGAPVPRFIALSGNYLIEEDLSGRSLAEALAGSNGRERQHLMEAAFLGLYKIKALANKAKFRKPPPLFRSDPHWLERFVSSPLFLSEFLGIAPPPIDYNAVIKSLKMPSGVFVKWGASPSNAHILEDGSVIWFDWNTFGLSAGYEDIGFLISDEAWPFEPAAGLALYRRFEPNWAPHHEAHLCLFASLRACYRLLTITQGMQEDITIEAIRRLAEHGAAFAKRSLFLRAAEPWFESLGSENIWRDKLALDSRQLGDDAPGQA